jgi:hypothetical protein
MVVQNRKTYGSGLRYNAPEGPKPNGAACARRTFRANGWRDVRTDLYLQGQGVSQQPLGHYWYATSFTLPTGASTEKLSPHVPRAFNEAWLYINGELVAHRNCKEPWWLTDYRFDWDVDLSKYTRPG